MILIDARLLQSGDLIAATSLGDPMAFDLHLVIEANPRYGRDGDPKHAYGLLKTIPHALREEPGMLPYRVFTRRGAYYLLVVPFSAYEPDMAARRARVPNYDLDG